MPDDLTRAKNIDAAEDAKSLFIELERSREHLECKLKC